MQTVRFLPDHDKTTVGRPTTILDAALAAGIFIPAQCGGSGTCGKCAVRVMGEPPESGQSLAVLGRERYAAGWRLACSTDILEDMSVEIPAEHARSAACPHPPARPISAIGGAAASEGFSDPPCERCRVTPAVPTREDNTNDLTRLVAGIKRATGGEDVSVSLPLLQQIPGILRKHNWDVEACLAHRGHDMRRRRLVGICPGGRRNPRFAVACDIGTTSLWASLLDIETGREVGRSSAMNPQTPYGSDVISRIVYAGKKDGGRTLQRIVIEAVDGLIDELVAAAGGDRSAVGHVVIAGNTVMSHLLLGLETKYLQRAPYVPAAGVYPDVGARDLGLDLDPEAPLFVFPSVASYVGGDIVAGVLASGLCREETVTLFIDIGTNGEIVLGNGHWMLTASASAGPAFEGGGVRFGMGASVGAIEGFFIDGGYEPMITTIGRRPPVGICGSGIINVTAGLFYGGVLLPNGKIREGLPTCRVRQGDSGMEYVLVWAADAAIDEDIVITDVDIENVMRAKAALFAGYRSLMDAAGTGMNEIGRVIISGAFGNFLDIENAVGIGLLPDIERDRFVFIGNGSLAGATLAALSRSRFREGLEIARGMTNVELSVDPGYMDRYMAAVFLPHTDIDLFPTVKKTLAAYLHASKEGTLAP
ncbi:MAG: DUF4445 domain-containing protein [Deltaproteobacteria bacterium]|nr:DUF4445 domain-containing protein [Candidatus Zymogenaceae bacterium]